MACLLFVKTRIQDYQGNTPSLVESDETGWSIGTKRRWGHANQAVLKAGFVTKHDRVSEWAFICGRCGKQGHHEVAQPPVRLARRNLPCEVTARSCSHIRHQAPYGEQVPPGFVRPRMLHQLTGYSRTLRCEDVGFVLSRKPHIVITLCGRRTKKTLTCGDTRSLLTTEAGKRYQQ